MEQIAVSEEVMKRRIGSALCHVCGGNKDIGEYVCSKCKEENNEGLRPKSSKAKNQTLYKAMKENKLNIAELSEKVGVTRRTIERYLYSDANPSPVNAMKINAVLGKQIFNV